MALQVWLQCNGSTENKGLAPISMTGAPASYEDGPIGQAAVFDKNANHVFYNTSKAFDYLTNFSVAFWIKNNYDSGTQWAWTVGRSDAGGYGYGAYIPSSTIVRMHFGNKSGIDYNIPVTADTWHHIIMCIGSDTDKIKFYKDGVLLDEVNYPTGNLPTYSDGNGLGLGCFHYSGNIYPFKGSLCDFRIYNHVLSLEEIKNIYNRLFLHYELNHGQTGNSNLVVGYRTTGALTSYSTSISGVTYETDIAMPSGYHTKLTIGSTTGTGGPYWYGTTTSGNLGTQINELVQDDWYVVSYYIKSNKVHSSAIITTAEFLSNITFLSQPTINTNWQKVVFTGQYNGHTTAGIAITIYEGSKWATGELVYLSSLKVEKGKKDTPYIPHVSDVDIVKYGSNNMIEYDTSGYLHNGTIVGSIEYITEVPRYYMAGVFDSCAKSIYTDPLRLQRPFSVMCWYKHDGSIANSLRYLISEGRDNPVSGMTLEIHGGYLHMHSKPTSVQSASQLTAGWHHCCCVFEPTMIKLYVDGVLSSSVSSSSAIEYKDSDNPKLVVGKMSYSYTATATYFTANGAISDVRIYQNALSAADIKELYETSMNIDSNGNISARVLTT